MTKILTSFFLLLIIYGCSYEPILSKSYDFQFEKISANGEKKINEIINNNLKGKGEGPRKFDIYYTTRKDRQIISSDNKGDAKIYKINIYVEYEIFQNGKKIFGNQFVKYVTYNNINDKFELSKYEENIVENLSETISSEILLSVLSL